MFNVKYFILWWDVCCEPVQHKTSPPVTLHSLLGAVVQESFAPTLGYNLCHLALLWARRQWRFPTLNCLPAYIVAYISIYNSFQLYHYVLSKLKWGVHKRVPTNEKIQFMWYQLNKTISFRLQFNVSYSQAKFFWRYLTKPWIVWDITLLDPCDSLYGLSNSVAFFLSTKIQLYLKCH